jgi:DNA processing protein
MATTEGIPIRTVTVDNLLGRRLNDIETKYAPQILYVRGRISIPLPSKPRVSIVGSRKASSSGLADAEAITKTFVEKDVMTVSGLAEGIDTVVHETTIKAHGMTIAVLGTPLNKTYPKKNFGLQQEIMHNHLAISQFQIGRPTRPQNFVLRNRTMALISDATIIIEATDTSGSLHQGWEAIRLGRPLFIWKSILNNSELRWPEEMLRYGAMKLTDAEDIFESLPSSVKMPNILPS